MATISVSEFHLGNLDTSVAGVDPNQSSVTGGFGAAELLSYGSRLPVLRPILCNQALALFRVALRHSRL